jgi:multiple sugar transport system ATP-binding protein
MARVSIRNVQKSFGALKVIDDISIDIEDGQFVVLVGPSGCGKSTLLRMIAGLEEVTAGDVVIGDRVVTELHPKDRDIAMVFQNYALYPHMNVHQNMGFSLRLNGVDSVTRNAKIEHAAGILNLEPYLDRYPRQLSGGQRQRVAMGRAIVRDPQVFLFDEPLSNLDAKLRVAMRAEIKALHQRLKTTAIYVTHDQVEAMTMADVIVVMNAGNVEQIGRPLDLYDWPQNVFVAGFIGSPAMNFLNGTLRPEGRPIFVTDDAIELPISNMAAQGAPVKAIYGIRPEHLQILSSGSVEMIADVVEPTGSEVHVLGRLGGQQFVGLFRERILPPPGAGVRFEPDRERVHLFDAQTHRRIGVAH